MFSFPGFHFCYVDQSVAVHGYVHKSTGPRPQKRASELFALKLRVHLRHLMWVLGPNLGPLQEQHTLNC